MNFSKLSSNEKLATYGSIAVIVGTLVASGGFFGFGSLALLAAIGMLVVVFLPQFSAGTNLPGSKGSLMLILGGIAGAILVLSLLSLLSVLGFFLTSIAGIFYLVAIVGGIVMAFAGWQEFQAEGGKFNLGTSARPSDTDGTAPAKDEPPRVEPPRV